MTGDCGHFRFDAGDPDAVRLGMGAAALVYQRLGYAVLPLARGAKKPHRMLPYDPGTARNGVHWATTDPEAVEWAWSQDPAANAGVATGLCSHLVVLDLDVKKGHDGPGELRRFLAASALYLDPDAPLVRTPSGGWHVWLRWPQNWGPVPERPGILPGVDVKGEGGLVVAPPSMALVSYSSSQPGDPREDAAEVPVPYEWHAGSCPCQAPTAPAWLPQWLASAPAGQAAAKSGPGAGGETADLDQLARTGAPVGERNATLYRAACSLYRRLGTGMDAGGTVIGQLRSIWEAGDTSGMPWREVLVIAESARRFVERSAAQEEESRLGYLKSGRARS